MSVVRALIRKSQIGDYLCKNYHYQWSTFSSLPNCNILFWRLTCHWIIFPQAAVLLTHSTFVSTVTAKRKTVHLIWFLLLRILQTGKLFRFRFEIPRGCPYIRLIVNTRQLVRATGGKFRLHIFQSTAPRGPHQQWSSKHADLWLAPECTTLIQC